MKIGRLNRTSFAKTARRAILLFAFAALGVQAETVATVGEAAFVTVTGIAGFADRKFVSFAEAYAAIKPTIAGLGLEQESATADAFDALFTSVDANGNATLTYTISGTVVYDETDCANLLTMGRKASHYGNGRHLINFKFVGATGKEADTLTVNSDITLPYEWWGEKTTTGIHFENLTITGSAPNGLYPSQPFFEGIDFSVSRCALNGIKIYNCSNVKGSYTITDSVLDGTGAPANSYAIHLQGNETAPLSITIRGNTISGYDRGINIDQKTAVATIEGNRISVKDAGRSCIQLSSLATAGIVGNTLELTGGNAITLHEKLLTLSAAPEVSISGNTVTGTGYLVYDDAAANGTAFTSGTLKLTYATDNVVAATVDTTQGVKGETKYALSETVATTLHSVDFAAFVDALTLTDAGYTFDGSTHARAQNGKLTVKWSPVSGCYDKRGEGHDCTVGNVIATANTPKRVNSGLTQFQLFEGASHAVSVKNVAFVYEPADFTVCENSGWKGSFTAEQAPAGQIYLMNTGDVTFEGCSFDKVVLTSFNCTGTSTVKDCSFKNVYNSYAVKDIRGANVAVTGCTFENCGAAVMVSSTVNVDAVTIRGNTFKNVDVAGTAPEGKVGTRGLVQIASSGDYADTAFDFSGNTATACGPVLRQLNSTVSFDADDKTNLGNLVSDGGASAFYTDDSFVAQVGDTKYATLAEAFAALSAGNHTLALLKDAAWNAATPVYWAAGAQNGYTATLTAALTAAYKANEGAITIVCRPGADVGTMTHGHVADDLTIYGNNAYLSGGECDLEVDQYKYSRATGAQAADGVYLDKNITITAYELDNLGVWGERHTDYTVTVNLTDCDGKVPAGNVQRVYISGTTGVNNITLTGCDFLTTATAVYSNVDGAIKAVNCSFTGGQVPFNINHKANGTQTVAVENCTFTTCGDNGGWKQFAAPFRLVNSGTGTLSAEVTGCAFTGTVGANGDILLGDGRTGQASNDVALTVTDTEANIQAQKPGYYGGETVDETKKATATSPATGTLVTSVAQLLPVDPRTLGYATSGKAEALPATPDMNGEVVDVTAAQAQYVLDGAYGPIDGKTINFTESINDTLILGRASKYDGSKTVYRHGRHDGEALSYADFIAYKNQSVWTEPCYYERTVENVTFTANEGVTVKNFEADGGAHIYAGAGTAPVYDYVRDTGSWVTEGSCYYKRAILKNITFKGLTFTAKTDINTSESTTVYDGFTFKNCTFDLGTTADGNQAIRYYNENNNGNVKNLVVDHCRFQNCSQGVYTMQVKGITVKNSTFTQTGHNAIAIQSQGGDKGPCNHGEVVITDNTMVNIGDRAIRFNVVAAGTTITITGNTAAYKDGTTATDKECIKAQTLAEGVTTKVELNNWNNYAVAANKPLTETVAKIGTTDYKSLEDATEAAQDGDVIKIVGYTSNMTAPDGWKFETADGVTTLVADPVLVKGVDGKFHIASYDDLLLFKKMVNEKGMNFSGETVVLDADISCTETWTAAIGTFTGTLDGNGKTISKLKVASASDHAALFSKIEGATVLGLTISEAEITSASGNYNAVLAAEAVNSTITGVQILSSTVTTAGEYAGAVYGGGYAAVSGCTVDKCAVTGTEQIGGLAGYMWLRSITDCTISETTVTATAQRAGLLVGKMQVAKGNLGASSMSISGNTVGGKVVTPAVAGGLIGQIMGDDPRYEIKDNDIDVVFECAGEKAPIGVLRSSQAVAFTEKISTNITGNWWENATLDANEYTYTNTNGAGDQVVVRGVAQVGTTTYKTLEEALSEANTEGAVCELIADVTLKGNWTPIPNFKGTFDGKNHKITGLNVSGSEYVGLIGVLDGGTIKNVQFASVDVSGGTDAGSAVGRIINGGTVDNVKVLSGTVSGSKRVGGVVGSIKACGTVKNCENAAKVEASTYNVGGIVGAAYYTETGKEMYITNCQNTADITSAGVGAGGIVGLSCANVSGNTNTGAVKGQEVGGIVGEQKTYGSVTGNTNSGAVTNTGTGNYGTGGIIGWLRYHGTSESAAYQMSAIITVSGNSNSGTITGGNDAGGIVGVVYNSAVITDNRNTAATLSGTTFAAGIVGNYQITETPAAVEPAKNKLTFTGNTSTLPLDNITAQNKDLLIYTNGNPIKEFIPVAQIGDQEYATLAEAFAAATAGQTVTLLADVDMTGTEWTPIDNFTGTFDGAGHTIKNLVVANNENYTGFFNVLKGTVKDVTFENCKVTGQRCGILAGAADTFTAQNVVVKNCEIVGSQKCGGLVGYVRNNNPATVTGCQVNGLQIKGADADGVWQAGGLLGFVQTVKGTVSGNTVSGISIEDAYKKYLAGGAAPTRQYASHAFIAVIVNTSNGRTYPADADHTLTISGNSVEQCAETMVYRDEHWTSFCGDYADWEGALSSSNPYPTKLVIDGVEVTAPVAKIGTNFYGSLEDAVAAVQDGETITVLNYDADNMTAPDGWKFVTEEGVTTLELDVITISTVEELVAFSAAVNGGEHYANKIVRLTQDLDMTGIDFVPIGNVSGYPGKSFYGVFDGQNHTIRNLTVSDTTKGWASAALFGSLCGTVQNVKLKNVNITSSHYAAALVGYSSDGNTTAVIKNCHVDGGTVTSTPEEVSAGTYDNGDKVGGLAGYLAQGVALEGCTVKNLTVTAYRDVAGLVGYANTGVTVKNSSVTDTTVVSDHRYNYKNYASDELYDANEIIGEASSSAVLTDNTFSNVDFAILENVAQIGETVFSSINAAFAAVNGQSGDDVTIKILKDVTEELTTDYEFAKNVTLATDVEGGVTLNFGFVYGRGVWALLATKGHVLNIEKDVTITNLSQLFGGYYYGDSSDVVNVGGVAKLQQLWACWGDVVNVLPTARIVMGYGDGMIKLRCGTLNVTGTKNDADDKQLTGGYITADNNGAKSLNLKDTYVSTSWLVNSGTGTITVDLDNATLELNHESSNGLNLGADATGTINMKNGSLIVTPKLQNVDVINVDATGLTEPVKVVDYTGAGTMTLADYGTVNVAEGCIAYVEDNDLFVRVANFVAQIGETKYETLQAAFDAAKTGDTVKLLSDITLTEQVNITKALDGLTLDGNGKTITCATTDDPFKSGGSALYFGNANDHLYCTGIKIKNLTMTGTARYAIFLCGGTTTEFTNVTISGNYYIAVNLYGTHGATMTNCDISNSTTGSDKYLSAIWSNVASANPLTLNNSKVDVIAINAYTTANTLEPKIFVMDGSEVGEIHTFDDGSVSGNKKLCVSASSTGTYVVKEYDASTQTWVDIRVVVEVTLGGEKKAMPFPIPWLEANIGADASKWTTEELEKKGANGLAKWQCYLFGLDPNKADAKVVATAGQGTEQAIPLTVANADASASPLVTGGYVTVAYVLMRSNDGTAWTKVATSDKRDRLAIPLTGTTYKFYRVDVTVTSAEGN